MLSFKQSSSTDQEFRELEQVVKNLRRLPEAKLKPVQRSIRAGFAQNFATESAGGVPWQSLAPSTIKERILLGYGGAHPILQRTGAYRASFVNEFDGDHVSTIEQSDGKTTIGEGSDNPLVKFHEQGGARIPQRQVLALSGNAQEHVNRELTDMVNEILHGR